MANERIVVQLVNAHLWRSFAAETTEMIITKQGRRMFPILEYQLSGLQPDGFYAVQLDFQQMCFFPWRYDKITRTWNTNPYNKDEDSTVSCSAPLYSGTFALSDNAMTGAELMSKPLNFAKLKLSNNKQYKEGQVNLIAGFCWLPRLQIMELVCDDSDMETFRETSTHYFCFPETQFVSVTSYQNHRMADMKVHLNPFASGIRRLRKSAEQSDTALSEEEESPCGKKRKMNASLLEPANQFSEGWRSFPTEFHNTIETTASCHAHVPTEIYMQQYSMQEQTCAPVSSFHHNITAWNSVDSSELSVQVPAASSGYSDLTEPCSESCSSGYASGRESADATFGWELPLPSSDDDLTVDGDLPEMSLTTPQVFQVLQNAQIFFPDQSFVEQKHAVALYEPETQSVESEVRRFQKTNSALQFSYFSQNS